MKVRLHRNTDKVYFWPRENARLIISTHIFAHSLQPSSKVLEAKSVCLWGYWSAKRQGKRVWGYMCCAEEYACCDLLLHVWKFIETSVRTQPTLNGVQNGFGFGLHSSVLIDLYWYVAKESIVFIFKKALSALKTSTMIVVYWLDIHNLFPKWTLGLEKYLLHLDIRLFSALVITNTHMSF